MITIENINGEDYTVIWHYDCGAEEKRHCVTMECWSVLVDGTMVLLDGISHIATALPALPRNPTAEDVQLLHRYMAEGIDIWAEVEGVKLVEPLLGYDASSIGEWVFGHGFYSTRLSKIKITHATYNNGCVVIAIKESE